MIIQTNAYICDLCHKVEQRAAEVSPWEDPVVDMPQGWGYLVRKHPNGHPHTLEYFACPDCMSRPDKLFEGEVLTPR